MIDVGLADIQKNISMISNMKEAIKIIDKRKKVDLAIIYPIEEEINIEKLAGKYKNRINKDLKDTSIKEAKEKALEIVLKEKYDKVN